MQRSATALLNGLAGVVIFSGSLPATRIAVMDFDPLFLTAARATLAGLLAVAVLMLLRAPRPAGADLLSLVLVAAGVVIGFPLFTALALQTITAGRSIVFIGLLPLATAIFGVLLGGERPRASFWLFALIGSACVAGYALSTAPSASGHGDVLMIAAVLVCGHGYAEGARLTRRLGGWQVICWALLLSLPLTLPACLLLRHPEWSTVPPRAWLALGYVAMFSMLIGFVFWYRGLAQGGIAAVGQLQLLQPFLGLALAGLLLGERVEPSMLVATLAVVVCVAAARRAASTAPQS